MTTIVMDFAWASIVIMISKLIRAKVSFIQKLYIPTPLLAGMFAIVLGPYCFDVLPLSDQASSYAGVLMTVMASSLALGDKGKSSFKSMMNRCGDQFLTNSAAYMSQWGLGLLLGLTVLPLLWPGINEWFGFLMPTGFAGGHGTASALGPVFEAAGFTDASSISITFATVGMLLGTFGGMVVINIGARKGWTAVVSEPSELPDEFKCGLYRDAKKREPLGTQTVCTMSMDTLTFCFSLIFIVALLAYKGADLIKAVTGIGVPTMALGMVLSMLVNKILNAVGAGEYVDKDTTSHIGGLLTDYLIFFGVATINLTVVANNWQPLVLMSIVGLGTVIFYMWMCYRHCDNYWFEKSMIIFGWATGATPTSILLVRTCDPEYKTGVFQNWVLCWLFVSIIDVFNTSLSPHFIIQGQGYLVSAILLGASAVIYVLMIARTKVRKKALK